MPVRRIIIMAAAAAVAVSCSGGWGRILGTYNGNDAVTSLLMVKCKGGSDARVEYYLRQSGALRLDSEGQAYIGKNGLGKTREGDMKTPEGDFYATVAFGILPDPGSALEYIDVVETTYACDEEGEYYNTIIDSEKTGHDCKGEHMISYTKAYAYGLAIDYNKGNVPGKGSAIFVHCKGDNPYTAGCVALDSALMRHILVTSGSGLVVSIHRKKQLEIR